MAATHEARKVIIKKAPIDLKMIPVVKWLNTSALMTTEWCCQGDAEPRPNGYTERPYVLFHCTDFYETMHIVRAVRGYAAVEVDWPLDNFSVRYCLRFYSAVSLDNFVKHLKKLPPLNRP